MDRLRCEAQFPGHFRDWQIKTGQKFAYQWRTKPGLRLKFFYFCAQTSSEFLERQILN